MNTFSVTGFQCRGCYRKMISALEEAGVKVVQHATPREGIQISAQHELTAAEIRSIIPECLDIEIRVSTLVAVPETKQCAGGAPNESL